MAVLPKSDPGRRRTCNPPGKNRELCRLSYGAVGCDRQGSNLRRPAFQAGALPAELRSREWAGPDSNQRPRTADCALLMSRPARKPNDVVYATRLPFDPGSPSPAARRLTTSYVEELWSPYPRDQHAISRQKQTIIRRVHFLRATPRVFLSQAGPRFDLDLVQAGHHLLVCCRRGALTNKKATPLGRPRLACYAASRLARMPPSEGYDVAEQVLRFEALPSTTRPSRPWLLQSGTSGCWFSSAW